VPVLGANGEECTKPELFATDFVDVDDCKVALAAGGDVEAEAQGGRRDTGYGGKSEILRRRETPRGRKTG